MCFVCCRRCQNTIKGSDAKACAVGRCPLCNECWELYGYCEGHSDQDLAKALGADYSKRTGRP